MVLSRHMWQIAPRSLQLARAALGRFFSRDERTPGRTECVLGKQHLASNSIVSGHPQGSRSESHQQEA